MMIAKRATFIIKQKTYVLTVTLDRKLVLAKLVLAKISALSAVLASD